MPSHLSNRQKLARASLLFITIVVLVLAFSAFGCGSNEMHPTKMVNQLTRGIIYKNISSETEVDGNDEQGPSTDDALSFCRNAFRNADRSVRVLKIQTCIKILTAQYFSSMESSFTFKGTLIYLADKDTRYGDSPRSEIEPSKSGIHSRYFEAIWNSDGALCIANPRWKEIFNRFKSEEQSVRNCITPPIDNQSPWLGEPFAGEALMISYSYNKQERFLTIKSKETNQIVSSTESVIDSSWSNYDVLAEGLVFLNEKQPIKLSLDDELTIDQDAASLNMWKCCHKDKCSHVTTFENKERLLEKIQEASGLAYSCQILDANIGYAYTYKKQDTSPIELYYDKTNENFVSILSDASRKIPSKLYRKIGQAGYVYPYMIHSVPKYGPITDSQDVECPPCCQEPMRVVSAPPCPPCPAVRC